jgi:hypothetical protein
MMSAFSPPSVYAALQYGGTCHGLDRLDVNARDPAGAGNLACHLHPAPRRAPDVQYPAAFPEYAVRIVNLL